MKENANLGKKLPRFLEYGEVRKLLDAPPLDNWLGARDRAILETLYSTGMRVFEFVALNMEDLDFLGEVIHIRRFGREDRLAPVSSSALQVIQHYIELRDEMLQSSSKLGSKILFVNNNGRLLNTKVVGSLVKKYLELAGLDASLGPSVLRHSFAVHMIRNGADLETVQELLGIRPVMAKVYSQLAGRLPESWPQRR